MPTQHAIYPSLRAKNILITGGAEGIGAAAVELFALQGAQVIILDISTSSAETLIARIKTLTDPITGNPVPTPIFHQSDVSDLPRLQSLAQEILETHKIIHVLINNAASAGSLARKDTMSMTPESWDYNMNVNLRHMFFLTQAFVPAMKEAGGGSIVNMGSITWRIPAVGLPAYTTIKAAIMGLTRTHSKEFGPWRQIKEVLTDEYRAEVMAAQSLKRDLEPMEVAKVIVFLASDEASAVTGSSYVVDGGWCSDP
jgi:NAD(P)-dependent dehydrogenase (short-subunit alcohol dehydrogenase family)